MFSLPTKCQTLVGVMMTAILVCGLTVLTACSTTDDPATPQPTGVTGQWISYEEKSGEITDDALPYDCIARVLQFNAVVESNIHARHLYERLGFVRVGSEPGALEALFVMEKKL